MLSTLAFTLDFVRRVVPHGARVLEVGAGDGELAAVMGREGWDVVALDADAAQVDAARARGVDAHLASFPSVPPALGAFDAVLFTRSLHHIHPLEATIDTAARLLRGPEGLLVAEEFALEAADAPTAGYFYATLDALALGPDARPRHHHHEAHPAPPGAGPLQRWHHEHAHAPALHSGAAMLEAAARRFTLTAPERVPYLFRSWTWALDPALPDLMARSVRLFEDEQEQISRGNIRSIGLRFTGTLSSRP